MLWGVEELGLVSAATAGFIVGLIARGVLIVESIRAVFWLTLEERRHRYVRWNWFNAFLRPAMFREQGRIHRDRAFIACGGSWGLFRSVAMPRSRMPLYAGMPANFSMHPTAFGRG